MLKSRIIDIIKNRHEIETATIKKLIYGCLSSKILDKEDAIDLLNMCKDRDKDK